MSNTVVQDGVSLQLTVEDFVTAETVKVSVGIVMVVKDETTNVRDEIVAALTSALNAEWRFIALNRYKDNSGMERVDATASVRVKESEITGITTKISEASKPGLQLHVSDIDYTPTKAQLEAAAVGLRRKIYEAAQREADVLNSVTPALESGLWRVQNVNFGASNTVRQSSMGGAKGLAFAASASMESMQYDSVGGNDDEGMDLTQKVMLSANVCIARIATN